MTSLTAQPAVQQDGGDLPPLSGSGSVSEKISAAIDRTVSIRLQRAAIIMGQIASGKVARKGA